MRNGLWYAVGEERVVLFTKGAGGKQGVADRGLKMRALHQACDAMEDLRWVHGAMPRRI